MSKTNAYYQMVIHNHTYHYNKSFFEFLKDAIEQMRENGFNAPATMLELHNAVEHAVSLSRAQKEQRRLT